MQADHHEQPMPVHNDRPSIQGMVRDDLADLIAEVLDQHHVSTDHFRRRNGWCWFCSCLTDGEEVHPDGKAARRAAARHQAEQVAEALAHGAPEVVAAAGLVSAHGAGSPHGIGPDHGGDR